MFFNTFIVGTLVLMCTAFTNGAVTITNESSTSTPPISTSPSPYPEPGSAQWNSSCILVKMTAQLQINYMNKDNQTATTLYNIPSNAVVEQANCESKNQSMHLKWGPPNEEQRILIQFETIILRFSELPILSEILFKFNIVGEHFPDAKPNQTIEVTHNWTNFWIPLKSSYHCAAMDLIHLHNRKNDTYDAILNWRDVQIEAYRTPSNSTTFSTISIDCDSNVANIFWLTVCVTLIVITLFILGCILFARRQRQIEEGYTSF